MEKRVIIMGYVRAATSDKFHQNQEVLYGGGIVATIKATSYKNVYKVVKKWKKR